MTDTKIGPTGLRAYYRWLGIKEGDVDFIMDAIWDKLDQAGYEERIKDVRLGKK